MLPSSELLLYVLLLSMVPTFEGRYALLVGVAGGLDPLASLASATLGTVILAAVLPLALPLIDRLATWLGDSATVPLKKLSVLYLKYVRRARLKAGPYVDRYGFMGLTIFVAIPLPLTGIWTAALVAYVLGMKRKFTFFALLAGGVAANLITLVPLVALFK
jgi:uncharacterized membrane protein